MYGSDVGELKVLMQVGQQSYSEVWTLSGDHGNRWLQGQAPMLSRGETFQVRYYLSWILRLVYGLCLFVCLF